MPRRQQMVRTNQAYRIDSKWEFLALVGRGLRGLGRRLARWRTELSLIALVWLIHSGLSTVLPVGAGTASWVLTGVVGLLVLAVPSARGLVRSRLACARSRRRVMACCMNTGVAGFGGGQLPRVAKSRSVPAGERLVLALRPGQSAELLEGRVEELRAAAKCRDVRVSRDPANANAVTVDVIRRDVLVGVPPVTSPLLARAAALLATRPTAPTPPGTPVPAATEDVS